MMGAISVVVDSHACPCLCLDALPSSNMNVMSQKGSTGGLALQRNNIINPVAMRRNLSSSFIDSGHERRVLAKTRNHKKQRKPRSLLIVSELGGQYEDTFEDVKAQLRNYFTYKAVRTVLSQLYEMNPTQYRWFYDFVATNQPGDGKRFIRILVKEKQDLAERVMVTRLHLYGKWVKKFDHAAMYKEISDQNLELMRERLMETVIWPSDDTNTEKIG